MAVDYVYDVQLSEKARDIMYDETWRDAILTEAHVSIPGATENHLNVESVDIDFEAKKFSYNISASSQLKMGLMSHDLNTKKLWFDKVIMGAAIAGGILCMVAGAPITGAVIIGGVIVWNVINMVKEAEVKKLNALDKIAEAESTYCNYFYHNPNEADKYIDGINDSWTGEFMGLLKILLYASIGIGIAGLAISFMKKKD